MATQSGGRVRVTSDRLPPLCDVGRHTLWPALKPRRGRRREDDAPAGSTRGLRGLRGSLDLDARHYQAPTQAGGTRWRSRPPITGGRREGRRTPMRTTLRVCLGVVLCCTVVGGALYTCTTPERA